jgi:type II secretory pathway pseudopilin PulG
MDLVAMAQTVRHYKFVTFPIILLIGVLGFAVMFLTPPEYVASGSYILVAPPPAPTQQQIARDPALGKINANNPLVSYGNLQVVGLILSQQIGTKSMEDTLRREGVDPRSTVVNDTIYANAPLLDVTGVGTTPAAATRSGMIEGQTLVKLLNDIQAQEGVTPGYRVTASSLVVPDQASLKTSSKLRDLIVVMVVGIILLFVAVSVGKARDERKRERAGGGAAWPGENRLTGDLANQLDLIDTANGHKRSAAGAGWPDGIELPVDLSDQVDLVDTANGHGDQAPRIPVRDPAPGLGVRVVVRGRAQARQDSRTSSKPPSSDPPKTRAQRRAEARAKAKELMRSEG